MMMMMTLPCIVYYMHSSKNLFALNGTHFTSTQQFKSNNRGGYYHSFHEFSNSCSHFSAKKELQSHTIELQHEHQLNYEKWEMLLMNFKAPSLRELKNRLKIDQMFKLWKMIWMNEQLLKKKMKWTQNREVIKDDPPNGRHTESMQLKKLRYQSSFEYNIYWCVFRDLFNLLERVGSSYIISKTKQQHSI